MRLQGTMVSEKERDEGWSEGARKAVARNEKNGGRWRKGRAHRWTAGDRFPNNTIGILVDVERTTNTYARKERGNAHVP